MMKKTCKLLATSLLLAFLLGAAAFAENDAKVMEVLDGGNTPVVFVKGIEGEVQSANALVGNIECPQITVKSLSDEPKAMRTLILLDNSLSIPEGKRDTVKDLLSELIASRKSNEQFAIGVFGEDLQVLVDFTDDYIQLKGGLDEIEFVDRDTYLTDVLYDLVTSDSFGEDGVLTYHRILVISDGVDSKSLGYTAEELSTLLDDSKLPIYTLGVYNKNQSNNEELKNMFALSRQTNADYFLLDEIEDPMEIVSALASDIEMMRFDINLENEAKDGSKKAVTLRIQTESGEIEVQIDGVRMPQETIATPIEEKPQEVPLEDVKAPEPELEPEKEINILVFVMIGVVIVALVAVGIVLILHFTRKKKKDVFTETEDPFQRNIEEGKTEIFIENSSSQEDGNTVQIWEQGRSYLVTLTDISAPARSYQKPIRDRLVIGRSAAKSDICIDYDQSVSSRHCAIERRGERFFLIDLQSSNCTFLNDTKVLSEVEIYSGSILRMGRVQMRVEMS